MQGKAAASPGAFRRQIRAVRAVPQAKVQRAQKLLPRCNMGMSQIDIEELGSVADHVVADHRVVYAQLQIGLTCAHENLARHMAEKSRFQVGSECWIQFVNHAEAGATVGHEGLEKCRIARKLFHGAHTRAKCAVGQGAEHGGKGRLRHQKLVNIHMDQPVHARQTAIAMRGIAGLTHLMFDRSPPAFGPPGIICDMGGHLRMGVQPGKRLFVGVIEIDVNVMRALAQMVRNKPQGVGHGRFDGRDDAPGCHLALPLVRPTFPWSRSVSGRESPVRSDRYPIAGASDTRCRHHDHARYAACWH